MRGSGVRFPSSAPLISCSVVPNIGKRMNKPKALSSLLLLLASVFLCGAYYHGPTSDHFDGTHFFNPDCGLERGTLPFLRYKLTEKNTPWPDHIQNEFSDTSPPRVQGNDLRVSYVGHSTILIQTQGVNILTDPIWSDMAGPVNWIGIKRVSDSGIAFEQGGEILQSELNYFKVCT
jgi:hypothetical protein